jgi:uncharacterized RDD family membrane protein YckC
MGEFPIWPWVYLLIISVPIIVLMVSKRNMTFVEMISPDSTQFKLAGIWSRIGGALIDLIIVLIICYVVMFAWGYFGALYDARSYSNIDEGTWEARGMLAFLLIDYLYSATLQSGTKQGTWGQRAMGLQVIKIDGSAVTFGTASFRYFVSLVSSILAKIGYLIAIFTEKKQTLHDLAAGVLVVRKFSYSEEISGNIIQPSSTASSTIIKPSAQPMPILNSKVLNSQSSEEDIWAFASNEMNSESRNEGLWAMCFASADGNEDKTKASYLKQRVEQLRLELKS